MRQVLSRHGWGRIAGATLVTATAVGAAAVVGGPAAVADPSAPPPFSSLPQACPGAHNPAKGAALDAPFTPYEVPFRAIINDGSISIPPNIKIPHLYATACGEVQLPQLNGTITASNIVVATPNVYIAGLEALPTRISFGQLDADIDLTPAPNGGLDITVSGDTTASVSTLGITCSIVLNAQFTTKTDGSLTGLPVTGPTQQGQAKAVSNSFSVPAVVGSNTGTCPPAVAGAFNKALDLPAAAGRGQFTTNFCFDFELEKTTIPPVTSKSCPWPQS
jgi:hypothetical protein